MSEDIERGSGNGTARRWSVPALLGPAATPRRPVIGVVDDDHPAASTMARAIRRRYGTDYDILVWSEPRTALGELERLRQGSVDVALVVASQWMVSEAGTRFLARTRGVYPTARRLITTPWGDLSAMRPVARALTLGEVDYHATRPWNEADEQFLATIGDILAEWAREQGRYGPAITIVGEPGDAGAQSLADIFQRWGSGPGYVDAASAMGRRLLAEHQGLPLPLVILPDGRTLASPTVSEVTAALGANAEPLSSSYDLGVLGSGPAGLSAAMNGAAEGLRVLLIEPSVGQASSSPMIRNYLGFPAGLNGAELLRRAWQQAWMFGVEARMGRAARDIRAEGDERVVILDDGSEVRAGAVVLATGAAPRRLGLPGVDGLVGRGVFYGSGVNAAPALAGEPVAVVGGGNAAAQAAVHLARYARDVVLLVREPSLAGSVSGYLRQQIGALSNVEVRLGTKVVEARGAHRLRRLILRHNPDGAVTEHPASALFVLIGAAPGTDWLPSQVARDEQGFVLTGADVALAGQQIGDRLPLETTMPGVFAAGDVRHGSIKRVAIAVGEGAAASQQVQRYRSGLAAGRTAPNTSPATRPTTRRAAVHAVEELTR